MLAKGTKKKIREDSGIGIKPISITGTKRLVRLAIEYALEHKAASGDPGHKGNIMKFTEGAFREWGYEVATAGFRDADCDRARELDSGQQGQQSESRWRRTPR